jgi:hypothetical protein
MDDVEWIQTETQTIAVIVRASLAPAQTTFITPNEFLQQIGFVVYPAGGHILPHVHKPIERHVVGTAETLIVRQGKLNVTLYDDERREVARRPLTTGDVLVLVSGGHGFEMLEDTILLEIKQGPYTGLVEKERF